MTTTPEGPPMISASPPTPLILAPEQFKIEAEYLRALLAAGKIEDALALEATLYPDYIKTVETEEHYHYCFSQWSDAMAQAGRERSSPVSPGDPNSICFVIHSGVVLGHTQVLFSVLDAVPAKGKIYIACFGQITWEFQKACGSRDITLIPLGHLTYVQGLSDLKSYILANKINTAVWLGAPTLASYALPYRLAHRQVLWSVKFHPIWLPEVDVHLCGRGTSYHGKPWTPAPFPLSLPTVVNDKKKVNGIRAGFPGAVLIGAAAREEKYTPEYCNIILNLLELFPHAHFLHTGRKPSPACQAIGHARSHFIGWVDTNLYGEVVDIFLETFPFGCGITGFQAMSYGTPLLSYTSPDTLYGYQFGGQPSNSVPILTATNAHDYFMKASSLIEDQDYRGKVGSQEQAYVQAELARTPEYAANIWRHIHD